MKLIDKTRFRIKKHNPTIHISNKGVMNFSKTVTAFMQLKGGDKVSFFQDADHPRDWYIKKTIDGIPLRNYKSTPGALFCNSTAICREIMKSLDLFSNTAIKVSEQPLEGGYYALLTSALKPKAFEKL